MEIKFGPFTYQVKKVKNLTHTDGTDLYGEITDFTIKLRKSLPPNAEFVILWHEVLHGVEGMYNLSLSEEDVRIISIAVAQLLMENEVLNWRTNGQSSSTSIEG